MILFFGPPGSGKSVQGQLMVERNGWRWLSTGNLFRSSQDPEVLKRMKTGELINDELTSKVLAQALQDIDDDTKVVLDGYPRNLNQVRWLRDHLPKHGREITCAILFEVPRDELIRRTSGRGRIEDRPEVIHHRLDVYNQKTRPVVDFYRNSDIPVFEIDGIGDIQDVHERIQDAVSRCLART